MKGPNFWSFIGRFLGSQIGEALVFVAVVLAWAHFGALGVLALFTFRVIVRAALTAAALGATAKAYAEARRRHG